MHMSEWLLTLLISRLGLQIRTHTLCACKMILNANERRLLPLTVTYLCAENISSKPVMH